MAHGAATVVNEVHISRDEFDTLAKAIIASN
jgi:hypothetical protein